MLWVKLTKYVIGLRVKNYHHQKPGSLLQDCDKILCARRLRRIFINEIEGELCGIGSCTRKNSLIQKLIVTPKKSPTKNLCLLRDSDLTLCPYSYSKLKFIFLKH